MTVIKKRKEKLIYSFHLVQSLYLLRSNRQFHSATPREHYFNSAAGPVAAEHVLTTLFFQLKFT